MPTSRELQLLEENKSMNDILPVRLREHWFNFGDGSWLKEAERDTFFIKAFKLVSQKYSQVSGNILHISRQVTKIAEQQQYVEEPTRRKHEKGLSIHKLSAASSQYINLAQSTCEGSLCCD